MAVTIIQHPLYKMLAADEEIIFVVREHAIVTTKVKVKFIAEVFVTKLGNATSLLTADKVATLKATPNNTGVGIFDFSRILEAYVSPEHLGGETVFSSGTQYYTQYNGFDYSDTRPHSIHQIDEFSTSRNGARNFAISFSIEYADAIDEPLTTEQGATSDGYYIHNAVRQEDDKFGVEEQTGNFGFNYDHHDFVLRNDTAKFLTNAPTIQYIGTADFHTLAFFQESGSVLGAGTLYGNVVATSSAIHSPKYIKFLFWNGGSSGAGITLSNNTSSGGNYWNGTEALNKIEYVGVGTANIVGAGGSIPANWDYYTVIAYDDNVGDPRPISDTYYFYNQEVCKGFEKFRLTWLNRLGVWDYFNFTKKNVRKVNSKRETYQQIKGSWNEAIYKKHGYKGGTKTFSTNSKEVVTLQTDFISEEAAQWLEELFTSPDVFVLQKRSEDDSVSTSGSTVYVDIMNKYVQPCIVTTSSYTRKTTANDKLKQYTIDIEMSHNKKTQRA